MRMLCPEPASFSQEGLEYASDQADLVAYTMSQEEFEQIVGGFDAALIRFNTRIKDSCLCNSPRLKAILSPTTGLDHIDLTAIRRNGVKLYHLREQKKFLKTITATAELTIGLMLSAIRQIPRAHEEVCNGVWEPGPFRGNELSGKILGLIGCGRLGRKVARVGKAFDMDVRVFDPFVTRLPAGCRKAQSIDDLLRSADILSIHVPLNKKTYHLVGTRELALMKPQAVVVNTSRGAVIDNSALLTALKERKLSAAAVDVLEGEENILKSEVRHPMIEYARTHSNLIITPHIGGATTESVQKTDMFILQRYFQDMELENG